MGDDDKAIDLEKIFSKAVILSSVIVLVLVILAFYAGSNYKSRELMPTVELWSFYVDGFQKCTDACLESNRTGYIRAIDAMHHKCFCYSNQTQVMRFQDESNNG